MIYGKVSLKVGQWCGYFATLGSGLESHCSGLEPSRSREIGINLRAEKGGWGWVGNKQINKMKTFLVSDNSMSIVPVLLFSSNSYPSPLTNALWGTLILYVFESVIVFCMQGGKNISAFSQEHTL